MLNDAAKVLVIAAVALSGCATETGTRERTDKRREHVVRYVGPSDVSPFVSGDNGSKISANDISARILASKVIAPKTGGKSEDVFRSDVPYVSPGDGNVGPPTERMLEIEIVDHDRVTPQKGEEIPPGQFRARLFDNRSNIKYRERDQIVFSNSDFSAFHRFEINRSDWSQYEVPEGVKFAIVFSEQKACVYNINIDLASNLEIKKAISTDFEEIIVLDRKTSKADTLLYACPPVNEMQTNDALDALEVVAVVAGIIIFAPLVVLALSLGSGPINRISIRPEM